MNKNTLKSNHDNNIEKFPLSRLDNHWPFSDRFAEDFF